MIRYSSIFFITAQFWLFFFFWDKLHKLKDILKKIVFIFNYIKFYLILDIENMMFIF